MIQAPKSMLSCMYYKLFMPFGSRKRARINHLKCRYIVMQSNIANDWLKHKKARIARRLF